MKKNGLCFLLTKEELRLLNEVCYLEPFIDDALRKAKGRGDRKTICVEHDEDLRDYVGALEYHAGAVLLPKIKSMVALSEKLKKGLGKASLNCVHKT